MIKIALAEDNGFLAAAIRQKVELFPDLEFVFHASNGEELLGPKRSNVEPCPCREFALNRPPPLGDNPEELPPKFQKQMH